MVTRCKSLGKSLQVLAIQEVGHLDKSLERSLPVVCAVKPPNTTPYSACTWPHATAPCPFAAARASGLVAMASLVRVEGRAEISATILAGATVAVTVADFPVVVVND